MDSLAWSRKYEVHSISRLMLRDQLGFSTEQVQQLTEEDMQKIADMVRDVYDHLEDICGIVHEYDATVAFLTSAVLAGKETDNQRGRAHEASDPGT